jgi:predicted acetyltransferase
VSVEVFRFREEFREGFGHVRSRVYRAGAPVLPEENLLPADCSGFVAVEDGVVKAAATALQYHVSGANGPLRMAGIAAVGVLPEARQGGVGSALMRGMLAFLVEDGYALTSLYGFRESWYRRFGFEVFGRRFQITAPGDRLVNRPSPRVIRELKASDFDELKAVESAMAARYLGYNLRVDEQWKRALGGDRPLTIYVAGDPAEAYLTVRLPDGFWGDVAVKEFAWSTPEGYESLLQVLRGLMLNQTSISWPEPGDSPFLINQLDQGIRVELFRPLMWKTLNADGEAFLRELAAHPDRGYCAEYF